jgi:hypothetical protein
MWGSTGDQWWGNWGIDWDWNLVWVRRRIQQLVNNTDGIIFFHDIRGLHFGFCLGWSHQPSNHFGAACRNNLLILAQGTRGCGPITSNNLRRLFEAAPGRKHSLTLV